MDSEQSAFTAAQMRHHRYMYFGKKQRYIEVFQCSGEDMSLVLTGGIPAPTAPVSPVGKTLLSPGMLNSPALIPSTPNAASLAAAANMTQGGSSAAAAAAAAAATAALMPQQTAAVTWEPIQAQVAALQIQQYALAQAQAIRSQQETAWLVNQLAAQQQLQQQMQQHMQLAAFANAQKSPWSELNNANASLLSGIPPPSTVSQVNSVVTTPVVASSAAAAAAANVNKQKSLIPPVFPASSALQIPQANVSTSTPNQPFFLINFPRFTSPMQSYPGKVTGVTTTSTANQAAIPSAAAAAAFNVQHNALIAPTIQYAASSILKRSRDHAFSEGGSSQNSSGGVSVKQPYSMANASNSTAAVFTMPPLQQPPPQIPPPLPPPISSQTVAFQPTQFYAPT